MYFPCVPLTVWIFILTVVQSYKQPQLITELGEVLNMVALEASKATVILVTGASGWVGGHVCKQLLEKGFSVRAAVRDVAVERVSFLKKMGCELVRVPDLLSDEGWADAMKGCAGLAHVASPVDLTGKADADTLVSMAVEGSERALRFAAEAGTVKRVVVTATMASVCGSQREKNPDHIWSEADKNDAPGTPYSKSKTAAEAKVWELAEKHKDLYSVTTVCPCHPHLTCAPFAVRHASQLPSI
jgi:dihydroflavonol-4-reductase